MCDREPLVTLLYVGLWSGCYIPHCFVKLPLSESRFESPNLQAALCASACLCVILLSKYKYCRFTALHLFNNFIYLFIKDLGQFLWQNLKDVQKGEGLSRAPSPV